MRLNIFQQIAPEFWEYVRFLLEEVSPFLMISIALLAVGMLMTIVIKAFRKAEDEQDFEYREY